MSLQVLSQTQSALRQLALSGTALVSETRKLPTLSVALDRAAEHAPVLTRLAEGLDSLRTSSKYDAAAQLLPLFSLGRALISTHSSEQPAGEISALSGATPGERSERVSGQQLATLREELRTPDSRAEAIETHRPSELRILHLLLPALDEKKSAKLAEYLLRPHLKADSGLVDDVEASLSGDPSGDAIRLRLIHEASPPRAHKLARDLLEARPAPELLAEIFSCLGDDPDALPLLRENAEEGPTEVRCAVYGALARQGDPAALAAVKALLGQPTEGDWHRDYPESLEILMDALPYTTDPDVVALIQSKMCGPDISRFAEDDRWSREDWSSALALTPPNEAWVCALFEAYKDCRISDLGLWWLGHFAPPDVFRAMLDPDLRELINCPDGTQYRSTGLILRAAETMSKEELYELLGPSFREDFTLHTAMEDWRNLTGWDEKSFQVPSWHPDGVYYSPAVRWIQWDERWLRDAIEAGLPLVAADIAGPGDLHAAPLLLEALETDTGVHAPKRILDGLRRIGYPKANDAVADAIEGLLLKANKLDVPGGLKDLAELLPDGPQTRALSASIAKLEEFRDLLHSPLH